jgi:hypothetical protein
MNSLKLTNAGQNSGNPLILLGAKFTYSWTNLYRDFPLPGQYSGVQAVQYSGWKNPTMNISFYIELTNPTTGTMTWTQWNMILRDTTNKTYLSLIFGNSDTAFTSFAGIASSSTTATSSIPIQVMDYNVTIDPSVKDKLFISMDCMETK